MSAERCGVRSAAGSLRSSRQPEKAWRQPRDGLALLRPSASRRLCLSDAYCMLSIAKHMRNIHTAAAATTRTTTHGSKGTAGRAQLPVHRGRAEAFSAWVRYRRSPPSRPSQSAPCSSPTQTATTAGMGRSPTSSRREPGCPMRMDSCTWMARGCDDECH